MRPRRKAWIWSPHPTTERRPRPVVDMEGECVGSDIDSSASRGPFVADASGVRHCRVCVPMKKVIR